MEADYGDQCSRILMNSNSILYCSARISCQYYKTRKKKRQYETLVLGTCVLSLLMGAELLLINLEKVAEKTK